jgi:hypothetical protein
MLDLIRSPKWLAGIACMIGGEVIAAWSIGHLSLSFVEPLLTMNLVFALLLAVPLSKASLKVWEVVGALVLCLGVALLSAARSARPIGLSFGSVDHWPAAAVIAGVAFVAVQAGRRCPSGAGPQNTTGSRNSTGRARAMLTGSAAGLVYGIQDALTRQTLEILSSGGVNALLSTWAPYALVGAGAIGIWLMQSAFSAGPLQFSLPAIAAGEPIIGILLGVIIFGDRIAITPGALALQAGGIAAMITGVIVVARAPALSGLRNWAPPSLPHPHVHVRHSARPPETPSAKPSARASGSTHVNGTTHANGSPRINGTTRVNGTTPGHPPNGHKASKAYRARPSR